MASQVEQMQAEIERLLNGILGEIEVYRLIMIGLTVHFSGGHPLGEKFPSLLKGQIESAIAQMPAPVGEPPEDSAKRRAMTQFRLDAFFRDVQALVGETTDAPGKRN